LGYLEKNDRFSATLKCGTKTTMLAEFPKVDYLYPHV